MLAAGGTMRDLAVLRPFLSALSGCRVVVLIALQSYIYISRLVALLVLWCATVGRSRG